MAEGSALTRSPSRASSSSMTSSVSSSAGTGSWAGSAAGSAISALSSAGAASSAASSASAAGSAGSASSSVSSAVSYRTGVSSSVWTSGSSAARAAARAGRIMLTQSRIVRTFFIIFFTISPPRTSSALSRRSGGASVRYSVTKKFRCYQCRRRRCPVSRNYFKIVKSIHNYCNNSLKELGIYYVLW